MAFTDCCAPLELLPLRLDRLQREVARLAPQFQRAQLAPLPVCAAPKQA
jgi:hypothetical protein